MACVTPGMYSSRCTPPSPWPVHFISKQPIPAGVVGYVCRKMGSLKSLEEGGMRGTKRDSHHVVHRFLDPLAAFGLGIRYRKPIQPPCKQYPVTLNENKFPLSNWTGGKETKNKKRKSSERNNWCPDPHPALDPKDLSIREMSPSLTLYRHSKLHIYIENEKAMRAIIRPTGTV